MKFTNTAFVTLLLVASAGCMHNRPEAVGQQGASPSPEFGSTPAQASTPPQTAEAPNNVERADKLIGEQVLTSDHLRSGKIDDFVVDEDSGKILYAIVGVGGVLGVGETRIAVPPAIFTEAKKGDVELSIDKHKLARAPQITRDLEKAVKADFLNNVYGYYGVTPTWQGSTAAPAGSFGPPRKVSELTGLKVVNNARQDIGKVETVVLDVPKGREIYLVISPTSDMDLGNNYFALPPKAVKLSTDEKTLVADVTRAKLANAPHFAKDDWSELSDTAWAQKVYQYYGQIFQTTDLQPTGRSSQTTPAHRN